MRPTHIGESGSSLLSLLIQILISSGNPLTDTPRNHVLPAFWASLSPVKLMLKMNYCKGRVGRLMGVMIQNSVGRP